MKKALFATCVALTVMTAGGCANAGTASELTAPPESLSTASTRSDAEIMKMLPQGVKIDQPKGPAGTTWKLKSDLDGDGKPETIAFFSRNDNSGSRGFVFLKEGKDGFVKVATHEEVTPGINWGGVVTSPKSTPMLAIGWNFGAAAGTGMDFYRYDGKQLKAVARIFENKVQILTAKDGVKYMAVWQKDTGDAYAIRFVRIDEVGNIVPYVSEDVSIFEERIASYEKALKEMPEAVFYWYYLADAQLQAGHIEDASASLAKAEEFKVKHPSFYPGNVLLESKRSEILLAEKKYTQAAVMLNDILKNRGTNSQVQDDAVGFFGSEQAAFAQVYIDLGDAYKAMGEEKVATEHYKKAMDELKKSANWTARKEGMSVYSPEALMFEITKQKIAEE